MLALSFVLMSTGVFKFTFDLLFCFLLTPFLLGIAHW